MKLREYLNCPICGIKKGRQFNHAKCSKILQQQFYEKEKARKKLRNSDINYLAEITR